MNTEDKRQHTNFEDLDVKRLLLAIFRGRYVILAIIAACAVISIIYALHLTPLYKSTITLYPYNADDNSGAIGQFKGIATMFGINTTSARDVFNIPDLVSSRRIREGIIDRKWQTEKFSEPVDLVTFWEINAGSGITLNPVKLLKMIFSSKRNGGNPEYEWKTLAGETLAGRISVGKGRESNLVSIHVWMEEPRLAADIANYISRAIVSYTIETSKSHVRLNRSFIEKRRSEVMHSLAETERKLTVFRERNRNIASSPQLQLDLERLLREVEIQKQIYITLEQQYEIARIEEVKETPSIIILDEAKSAIRKDKPKRRTIVVMFVMMGLCVGVSGVVLKDIYFT